MSPCPGSPATIPPAPAGAQSLSVMQLQSSLAMPAFVPILLVAHITLAIALFVPSLLLPFTLQARRATVDSGSGLVQALLWMQARGTGIVGLGLLATGIGLIAVLGTGLLGQPWLIAALSLYAVDLGLAFFIQRPNLRRLIG